MRQPQLPSTLTELVENLKLVQVRWQERRLQIPKFAIYSILYTPVYDSFFYRKGRRLGLITLGRYQVPVLNPSLQDLQTDAPCVLVLSHCQANRFGLYALAVDQIEGDVVVPATHPSTEKLVKNFV